MNFIEAFKTCVIEKYCCFQGRARRSEFWYFQLATTLISWAISIFGLGAINEAANQLMATQDVAAYMTTLLTAPATIVSFIVGLAFLLPFLGVTVRRLHDIGKSGWWLLGIYVLCCIPIINFIVVIYFIYLMCKDSEYGENEYGPNPKGLDGDSSEL